MSLVTGNEIMMFLDAWSTEKIILGSLLLKLAYWTWIKKDKALVSCFYSPEPAVGIFLSKTFPKRKAAPQTESRECKSMTPVAVRHLGKPMQRNGRSSYDRLKWVTSVSWSHWQNTETTSIFRNDPVISNAYLMISVQLSCSLNDMIHFFKQVRFSCQALCKTQILREAGILHSSTNTRPPNNFHKQKILFKGIY